MKVRKSSQIKKLKNEVNSTSGSVSVVKKKLTRKRYFSNKSPKRGVVYLSHIPHGFYEDQIKAYFTQFGNVTAINLPRSRAGRSKGYAFIEFQHSPVAKIAAEAMDNYTMCNRNIKAKYLSPKEQKPYIFRRLENDGSKTVKDQSTENTNMNRNKKNTKLNKEKEIGKAKKLKSKHQQNNKKLEDLGLFYEYGIEDGDSNSNLVLENKENKEDSSESEQSSGFNSLLDSEDDDQEPQDLTTRKGGHIPNKKGKSKCRTKILAKTAKYGNISNKKDEQSKTGIKFLTSPMIPIINTNNTNKDSPKYGNVSNKKDEQSKCGIKFLASPMITIRTNKDTLKQVNISKQNVSNCTTSIGNERIKIRKRAKKSCN